MTLLEFANLQYLTKGHNHMDKRIEDAVKTYIRILHDDVESSLSDDLHDEGYTDQEKLLILNEIKARLKKLIS